MNRRNALALPAVVILLAGCASASPATTPPPSGSPLAPVTAADCRPIDIRSPTGDRIDLTGTWEAGIFIHHVRQVGECVWWIGYARWPGTEPGELATLTFFGHLTNDFTLSGSFTTIVRPGYPALYYPGPQGGWGYVAFTIGFDPNTGAATTLTRVGAGSFNAAYLSDELRLIGPLPESANPPPQ